MDSKYKPTICVVLLCLGILSGCRSSHKNREGEYYDAENHFSIIPPEDWEQTHNAKPAMILFLSPQQGPADTFSENINIVREKIPASVSLQQYHKASQKQLKSVFPDFKQVSTRKVTINEHDAIRMVSTYSVQGVQIKGLAYLLVDHTLLDPSAYVITCTATPETFSQYEQIFDQACETFIID